MIVCVQNLAIYKRGWSEIYTVSLVMPFGIELCKLASVLFFFSFPSSCFMTFKYHPDIARDCPDWDLTMVRYMYGVSKVYLGRYSFFFIKVSV